MDICKSFYRISPANMEGSFSNGFERVVRACCQGILLFALLVVVVPASSSAQTSFKVQTSTPSHGAVNVNHEQTTTIRFEFNRAVSTLTDWNTQFVHEPQGALEVKQVDLLLNDLGQPAVVEFEVKHQANTDYTWLVYAVRSADETNMTEPYVLRYTTSSERGTNSIEGSIATPASASAPAKHKDAPSLSRETWQRLTHMARSGGLGRPVFNGSSVTNTQRSASSPASRANAKTGAVKSGIEAPDFTSVFLLEDFSQAEGGWEVRSGTAINGDAGSYSIDYVREGEYWPLAVRYADRDRTEIEALGFYDADGDGAPNPITVNSSQSGIDLQLYEYPLTTAQDNRVEAQNAADAIAEDQEFVLVEGGNGSRPEGTAYEWRYHFFSMEQNLETIVTVNPLGLSTSTASAPSYITQMAPLSNSFVDSDEALQIVLDDGGQEFIEPYPPRNITTYIKGGNLHWLSQTATSNTFWHVTILVATGTGVQSFERFVDMDTGDILPPDNLPVDLASFSARLVNSSTVLLEWQTASETNNAGFEVEQALPGASDFKRIAFVDGKGTTAEPQRYQYRVENVKGGNHRFRLRQVDLDGSHTYSAEVEVRVDFTEPLVLGTPYPNPFSSRAELQFGVEQGGPVTIELFDALGQRVRTLYDDHVQPGRTYPLHIDGQGLTSGRYFIRLITAEGHVRARTLTVVK